MELSDEKKNIDYNFLKLIKFVIQYSKEKNKKIIFALKRRKPKKSECSKLNSNFTSYWQEQEWFKKNLSISEYKFLKKRFRNQNHNNFSSQNIVPKDMNKFKCSKTPKKTFLNFCPSITKVVQSLK